MGFRPSSLHPRLASGGPQSWTEVPSFLRFLKPSRLSAGGERGRAFLGLSSQTQGTAQCALCRESRASRTQVPGMMFSSGTRAASSQASLASEEVRRAQVESKGSSPLELDSAFRSPVPPRFQAQVPFLTVPVSQENTLSLEFFTPTLTRFPPPVCHTQ